MSENGPDMVERSFIFLPGVGATTETRLWKDGIDCWDRFLENEKAGPIKGERKGLCDSILSEAKEHLKERNLPFLRTLFKGSDSWRLWDTLSKKALFLDIETTGTRRTSPITVVGVYDGKEYRTAIRGKNISRDRISEILDDGEIIVTFNGASFDLPMIEHQFPGSIPDVPHLDLRFLSRKCGYSGGLKKIEIELGVSRPDDVKGMSGEDAVRLWRLFERDLNRNALKLLLKYNLEDIKNLGPMTEILVRDIKGRSLP